VDEALQSSIPFVGPAGQATPQAVQPLGSMGASQPLVSIGLLSQSRQPVAHETNVHVPVLQEVTVFGGLQVELQQTPATQLPEVHSLPVTQPEPLAAGEWKKTSAVLVLAPPKAVPPVIRISDPVGEPMAVAL
jgi:hypothetical protein